MCGIKYQFFNLISSLVELKSLDVFKNTVFKPLLVFIGKNDDIEPYPCIAIRRMRNSDSTGDSMVKCNGF